MNAKNFVLIPIISLFSHLNAGQNVQMSIQPSSNVVLKGTSTLHDYECKTSTILGTIDMDTNLSSFTAVSVKIPVKSIHSESSSMDDNMYDALKEKDYPNIMFSLLPYDTVRSLMSVRKDSMFQMKGKLTIAGKENIIDLDVVVLRKVEEICTVKGKKKLLMTDYGIKPPTFMLGVLKAGNEVSIEFELELKETLSVNRASSIN